MLRSVRGNLNNYKRFEGIGDEEADEVEEVERAQLKHNIELLADKLSAEEQAVIMAANSPEEQARLLQEAIAAHPELGLAAGEDESMPQKQKQQRPAKGAIDFSTASGMAGGDDDDDDLD